MKRLDRNVLSLAAALTALLLACGCASTNVNPAKPRVNTAYLDFYTAEDSDLAWDVRRFDSGANDFKILYREYEPLAEKILRVAVPPGRQKLRITFLNRVISQPAEIELEAVVGSITPIEVKLIEAGATSVRTEEYRTGGTARGRYGRAKNIGSYESQMYKVSAQAQPPQSYQPKEQMPYLLPPPRNS
jgi:hypothetical protein